MDASFTLTRWTFYKDAEVQYCKNGLTYKFGHKDIIDGFVCAC